MAGRAQQCTWCVVITFRAASGDDTTTVGTMPRLRSMTGPCCLASAHRLRCGSGPIWCRLPTRGSACGPGGRFRADLRLLRVRDHDKRRMETRERATATTRVAGSGSRHCWSRAPGNSAAAIILAKYVLFMCLHSHMGLWGYKFMARLDCGVVRLLPESSHGKNETTFD